VDGTGFKSGLGQETFLFSKSYRNFLGPKQPSILWVPVLFPGVQRSGRDVYHSSQSKAEVKNEWSNNLTPAMCLHGAERGNFIFYVVQQPTSGLRRLTVEVARSHTHTEGRTPLKDWAARRRGRYLHNTRRPEETNVDTLSGIPNRDSCSQAAANLSRNWERHIYL
jgi:hypothetical protein